MSLFDQIQTVEPTVLVAAGIVLVVVPEPATSALGVGLMLLGAAWWFQEWRSPSDTDRTDGERAPHPPRP